MLTIKAPLELKSAAFTLNKDNGFADRIRGNYELMGSRLSSASLTHLLQTPPEILYQEAEDVNIASRTDLYAFRLEQQSVINNVVNRILLSSQVSLTYQDRTYITDVLHRLGIRDDRRFMREARLLLNETENNSRLTRLYLSHVEELKGLIGLMHREEAAEELPAAEEAEDRAEENRLALSIMNRLQTGAVYQIFHNMNRSIASNQLNTTEIRNSEESWTARQLLLSRFREIAAGTAPILIYRAENVYEEEALESASLPGEQVREKVTEAVFLELIRSFSHAVSEKTVSMNRQWMDFRQSFFRTADNTLERILTNVREERSALRYDHSALETVNEAASREIRLLTELFRTGTGLTREWILRREREALRERQTLRESREVLSGETVLQRDTETEFRTDSSREYSEQIYREEAGEETLVEELDRINRQNVENLERYREIRRILREEGSRRGERPDRERTLRDSLRFLQNRDSVRELLTGSTETFRTAEERITERVLKELPPETAELFRTLFAREEGRGKAEETPASQERLMQELVLLSQGELPEESLSGTPAEGVPGSRPREERPVPGSERPARRTEAAALPEAAGHGQPGKEILEILKSYERLVIRELRQEERLLSEQEKISRIVRFPGERRILLRYSGTGVEVEGSPERTDRELLEEIREIRIREDRAEPAGQETAERLSGGSGMAAAGTASPDRLSLTLQLPHGEEQRGYLQRSGGTAVFRTESVSMVFRQENHLTEEEIQETLEEFRKSAREKKSIPAESPKDIVREELPREVIRSGFRQSPVQSGFRQEENISEILERTLRRQLPAISDEVYQRLERRLQTEKRRRGI